MLNEKARYQHDKMVTEDDLGLKIVGINGCVEAPMQLILTIFLVMKGIFNQPWSANIEHTPIQTRYDNQIPLVSIPLISFSFSLISILKHIFSMNIFNFGKVWTRLDKFGLV